MGLGIQFIIFILMKKELRLFDLTMIVVGFVIGMGIFRTPVNVAAASPTPFVFYACWLAGGLVALSGALTYAEIGSRLPATGGYYKVFAQVYHPSIAFAINCIILVSNAASLAAVALVGSEYFVSVIIPAAKNAAYISIPSNASHIKTMQVVVAIVCIIIFYLINLLGLKMSSKTQNVLMLIKIGLLLMLISPLFFLGDADAATSVTTSITKSISPTLMEYIKAFGVGLVAVSFTYGGYQQTINFGEEVKNPNRNIPRGIFFAIALIITLYMLVNYAYVKVIGFDELKTSKNIAAIMASKIFGPRADIVLSVLLFLGVLAYINGSLLSNPRVMYAMSKDQILPSPFTKQNSNGALTLALSVFAGIAVIVVFWVEEFDRILSFTIFLDCFGMALSAASIFVLRKRTKNLDGTGIYKMKLYPLLPVIFIINYLFVAIAIAMDYEENKYAALKGLSVLAAFIVIYFIFYRHKKIRK